MTDVPLEKAQVIWDRDLDRDGKAKILVVGGDVKDDKSYGSSWGACNSDFALADSDGKLRMLLTEMVHLTVNEKLPAAEVHEAFMVIPEYRQAMRDGAVTPPEDDAEY